MMGYDMGKCFHNRKHPVIAPWIRMVALTAAWVVLWANLGMVTSMGAQAGAGNLVEARAGSQADAWAGTQADTGQRLFDEAGLLSGEEQERLEEALSGCRTKTGMDVSAVTAYNDGVRSAMEYAARAGIRAARWCSSIWMRRDGGAANAGYPLQAT